MLTDKQVVAIRKRRANGESVKALAQAFGESPQTISNITTGFRRRDAGGPISAPSSNFRGVKVTAAIAKGIARLRKNGKTMRQIAAECGVSRGTVCKALSKGI